MNRIAMIAAACTLGLLLTACGDNSAPKQPVVTKTVDPAAQTTPVSTEEDKGH